MTTGQLLIIVFTFTFTGWFIAWMSIKILFWPIMPIKIGRFKLQGIIPAKQELIALNTGSMIQSEFLAYNGFDEKVANPDLLKKLKPMIENHVDHFLKEKLKTVFPLLSQFMGEKTISQFKTAFLTEIDILFPLMVKNYMNDLKNNLKLDNIISEKINVLSMSHIREIFYLNAAKEIRYFKIACTCFGLFGGLITVLILGSLHA
jgi:uncharacterized membrane-anchored protein YjiN (DUF445 family)